MSFGFCPEIVYACSLTTFRPWRGEPGALLLLRTTPFPRTCGPVRLSVRVALCGDRRAQVAVKHRVGPFAGPKRMVLVSGGTSGL